MKVINKLKNASTFDEALFQIYIAKCIIDGEFNIEFLEVDNKNKIVDWKITDPVTKDELLVELTELRFETSEEKDSRLAFETIVERIMKNSNLGGIHTLFYRGRLFKPYISRPTLQQISKRIDSTARKASKNGFAELIEINTITLALATVDKKHLLIPWAIEKNVLNRLEANRESSDSSFSGLPYPINEVKRIKSKIEDKKRQFDRKSLNALVIRTNRLFLPALIEQYIDILEQVVFDHDYLGILVVVGGHVGGLEVNSRKEGDAHLYLIRGVDLITKEILILTNIHSMDNMKTLNFSSKIKNAFESCKTLLF